MGSCVGRDLQVEFKHWQVVVGVGVSARSKWDVRGGRGQWQEGDGGEAVADTAGGRQTCQ